MHPTIFILLVILMVLLAIILSVSVFGVIRYTIYILFELADIKAWRSNLKPGDTVLVAGSGKRMKVHQISGDLFQLISTEGQLSGHHISTIYPISRNHGTTK